jgi:hypothetical protein
MDEKLKYLEMIQSIISRMANNSFLIRGWSITLVAALFALSAKDSELLFLCLAYFPAIAFWILDGYYLNQERLFRDLYNKVRIMNKDQVDFSMDTSVFNKSSWYNALFSKTILIFHGVIIGSIIAVMFTFIITK